MRQLILLLAISALGACHWFTPDAADTTVEANSIPAKTETQQEAFAQPGQTGGLCGGIAGFRCESADDFCRMFPGECHEISDAAGTCAIKPTMCTMQYEPVCGCDGKTYGNSCTAATQSVSIAYNGACRSSR